MDITELNRILLRSNIAGVVTSSNGIDDANKLVMTKADGTIDSTFVIPNAALNDHINDTAVHLTEGERAFLGALTPTATELNYVDGVTSAIQTQLDAKTTALNAHAGDTTRHLSNEEDALLDALTATAAELNHSVGVTSAIQTQLDAKTTALNNHIADETKHLTSAQNTWIDGVSATSAEVNHLVGVTSAIQTQLDSKASAASVTSHTEDSAIHLSSPQADLLNALTASATEINYTDGVTSPIQAQLTAKTTALNNHIADEAKHLTSGQNSLLDALTASAAELNYSVGVTSDVQTQLDAKTTALNSHIADAAKHLTSGQNSLLDALTASAVELNHSVGVTSAIQTQLDTKAADADLTTHIADATKHLTSGQNALLDAVTVSATELNRLTGVSGNVQTQLDAKAVASDLTTHIADETKHLTSAQNTLLDSLTASAVEINYVDGVTANIQDQLDTKAASSALTTHIADATKHLTSGQNALLDALTASATELNYSVGVTSAVQTQLDSKAVGTDLSTHIADNSKHLTSGQNALLDALTPTATELNYVDGVTSAIQTQLDAKASVTVLNDAITDLEAYADAKVDNIPDWDAPSQTVAPSQEAVLEMFDLFKMSKITYDPANKGEQVLTIGDIATELEAADSNNAVTLITPATLSVVVTDALVDAAAHIANTSNPHSVTKTQVGLGNCDNTSDVNKPVSTLTQAALDLKADGASLTTHIADETKHLTSTQNTLLDSLTATVTELNYVDGVTSAIQTQLDSKATISSLTSHTDNISNPHSVTKTQVGLGNCDNTSDVNKPISTATQAALDLKAPLASPALTGVPTVPTAISGTNSTQAASTAFVKGAIDDLIAGTPGALDTLNEIATQLALDEDAVSALTIVVASKVPNTRTVNGYALSSDVALVKSDIGLGNCDNTSDVSKPISTLTQAALDLKAAASDLTTHIADETKHLTSAQNTLLDALTATAIELNYVDGVTSAIQTQLNDKASNAAMADRLLAGNNLADLYDPAEARTNLGLSDGALLPLSSQLQAEAGVHTNSVMNPLRTAQAITAQTATPLAGKLAIASNLSDLNNAGTARTNLGLAIGSNVQAYSANLTTYAGIAPSANVQSLLGAADHNAISDMLNLGVADDAQFGTIQVNSILTTLAQFTGDFIGTLSASTLTSVRSWLLPDADGLLVSAGDIGTVTNTMLTGGIALSKLSITGTPNGAQFLRDDGTWQAISSGITIGSTGITGGTSGRLLTSGTTVGELILGTGVSTALGIDVGSSGAVITNGGALGTPSSGTGTNITGIPPANITGTAATLSGANVFTSTSGVTINDGTNSGAYKITGTDRSVTLTLSSFGNGLQIAGNGDLVMAGGRIRLTDSVIGTRYGYLFGVAADHVGLTGNGGAEKFSVYGTTNETNYERFTIATATGAAYTVGAQAGGTGTLRGVNAVGDWTFTAPTLVGATMASGTLTASAPITISQTWNNAAVAFTGLDLNITETAAAGLSTYMRVRTSRSNADVFKLQYSQYGTYTDMILGGTTADATSIILRSGYGQAQVYAGSLGLYSDVGNGFIFASSNGTVLSYLSPVAAKIFQRNSTTAQAFNVCNTFTSSASFEAMSLDWSSNVGRVGTLKGASGGSAREWVLHHDGTEKARVSSSGFTIGAAGTPVSSVISATATLDFNLTSVIVQDLTMTVTGAAVGDVVSIGVPHGSVTATAQYTAWVSATNTVTVRCRTAVAGENPASGTFRATIIKH